MGLFGRERIPRRSRDELTRMRAAGLLVGRTLAVLASELRPGMTTLELDTLAETHIRDHGGVPNFQLVPGYRHTLCTSVNDEIVHGIPGERVLLEGDLVSIDCGAQLEGWNGDAAMTLVVGGEAAGRAEDLELSRTTEESLWAGIAALRVGADLHVVGAAIEDSIRAAGRRDGRTYGIVEDYVGHGIGRSMHEPPNVPNYRMDRRGPELRDGTTIAIEPMATLGDQDNHVEDDDWTVSTDDGARAAHWEHSVALTSEGICVLTALDGGADRLRQLDRPVLDLD